MKHRILFIIWISVMTYSNIFSQYRNWIIYDSTNSPLPSEGIVEVKVENLSNFWVGTYGYGIYHYYYGNWTHYDSSITGRPINNTFSIEIDTNNNKWFGTGFPGGGGNGLFKFDGSNWTTYDTSNSGIGANGIWSLKIDGNGLLWIGNNNGISTFDGQNWNNITLDNEFRFIVSISFENDDAYWFGTNVIDSLYNYVGGLYKYNPNNGSYQKSSTSNSGLPNNNVFGIDFDISGNTWLATHGGGAKFDGNSNWETFNTDNSEISGNMVFDVKVDANGNIWFATIQDSLGHGGGVSFYNGSEWITYDTTNSEITSNFVSHIEIDTLGNKYFSCGNGVCILKEIDDVAGEKILTKEFRLYQNFPNPFNPSTKIKYTIPQSSNVLIKVFDVLGNEVETLVDEEKSIGNYELTWNAANLPSGVYFYQLRAGDFVQTKKMMLLR